MKKYILIFSAIYIYLFISPGFSHGVTGVVRIDNAVIAEIRYDDGEPFSYSLAKIYTPDNEKIEYQNSRTDASGRIAFVPDKKGIWKIVVSDDTGHGKTLKFKVADEKMTQKSGDWKAARRQKMILSILIVWAIAATSMYFMARNKLKKPEDQ